MIVTTADLYKIAYGKYAIGTSHGPYKFKGKQSLHFEVIREIQQLLPGTPIVMHGSSSVPEEEVRRINAAGGKLDPSAREVDEEEYLPAARLGSPRSISIPTEGWSGLGYIGNFFAITPNSSISGRLAKPLWKNTRSSLPARTKNFAQPDSCPRFVNLYRSGPNSPVPLSRNIKWAHCLESPARANACRATQNNSSQLEDEPHASERTILP
jgi:hypothetical protein